jgi:formylglycine-generating enzyme required for sulfatase activity
MMGKAGRYHALRGFVVAVLLALIGCGVYEGHGTLQARALRDRLLNADTNEVPTIVQDMALYRRWLDSLLYDAQAQAEKEHDPRKQLHTSLALLPVDSGQVNYLYGRLLDAAPNEVPVIRDALAPHKEGLLDKLWAVAEAPEKRKESQRLRAAAALAKYDRESERWAKVQVAVANDLVKVPAVHLGLWMESLRRVRDKLLPQLSVVYGDATRRAVERSLATDILADYAAEQPQVLSDLLMDADSKQFGVIYPKLRELGEQGLRLLSAEIDKKLPPDLPSSDERRENLAKRQANAAVTLLRMNQPEKVWPLLNHRPDPRVRSYLIHRLGPMGVDVGSIVKKAEEPETDVTIRRALLLSLGPEEVSEETWRPEQKKRLVGRLQELYRTADDPGLRAAAEWLLRQWHEEAWLAQTDKTWAEDRKWREKRQEDIRRVLRQKKAAAKPQWYVTGQGQTMVVLPGPMEFRMGSPATEKGRFDLETQHRKLISRTFALAAKPVTLGQFQKHWRAVHRQAYDAKARYTPTDDCPVNYTNWFMAAAYCNWLSDQEGIEREQWCYEMDEKGQVTKLKRNYLSLTGYRLPTEAEWEYTCRAGTVTSRYYGESEELLSKYAWYQKNAKERTWPVGSKKPNDLGLFDMHGNVYSWCQEGYQDYPASKNGEGIEDKEGALSIKSTVNRVLRGGSFGAQASLVRSADRFGYVLTSSRGHVGFRPARTFTP